MDSSGCDRVNQVRGVGDGVIVIAERKQVVVKLGNQHEMTEATTAMMVQSM